MNLSFAGCGFLGIYHLGVSKTLASNGKRFLDNVHRFGGASAGALVASVLAVNGSDTDFIEQCREFCLSLAHQTRDHMFGVFTPGTNLLTPLAIFLDETLPTDAHEKATGRLYISVTDFETRKNEIVSVYRSKQELVQYLLATSCIPFVTASKPVTIGGRKFYDGGITNNLPMFNEGSTILVSPFDGRQDICPNDPSSGRYMNVARQDFRISVDNLVRGLHAFLTPSDKVLNNYFKQGEQDACRYLKKMNLYDSSS